MTSLAEALSMALLHFVWQGIAGGVVWGIVLIALRKSSADSRYVAGCIVLAALALAPVITICVAWQTEAAQLQTFVDGSDSLSTFVATMPRPVPETLLGSLESWILPLWAGGVLVFTLRLAWAGGHASSLRRHGVEADSSMDSMIASLAKRLGVRRKLRVLMSSVAEVPAVVGWILLQRVPDDPAVDGDPTPADQLPRLAAAGQPQLRQCPPKRHPRWTVRSPHPWPWAHLPAPAP